MTEVVTGRVIGSSGAVPVKLLVMVLSLDRPPWSDLELTQRATWAVERPEVRILYVRGKARGLRRTAFLALRRLMELVRARKCVRRWDSFVGAWSSRRPVQVEGGVLKTSVPETWILISAKTKAAISYVANSCDFDYILRTNSSTYIDIASALAYLEAAPRRQVYGGPLVSNNNLAFIQGTGILMSRDVATLIGDDPAFDFGVVDDGAVGRSVERLGIEPVKIPQIELRSSAAFDELPSDPGGGFLFRCKAAGGNRTHDQTAMRRLHALLGRGFAET